MTSAAAPIPRTSQPIWYLRSSRAFAEYRNPACVLDVYLYPDHDRLTVTHAEARASAFAGDALSPCIAKFAELRHKTTG